METMSEIQSRTAKAEAEGHRKMLDLCWALRAQLEHLQPFLSASDYSYVEALKTFMLRARGV